jgi:hypothetical protein
VRAARTRPRRSAPLPDEHYLDSGYPSADLIVKSRKTYGIALVTPVLLDRSRQARENAGFQADAFTIDWKYQQVTCPQGQTSQDSPRTRPQLISSPLTCSTPRSRKRAWSRQPFHR